MPHGGIPSMGATIAVIAEILLIYERDSLWFDEADIYLLEKYLVHEESQFRTRIGSWDILSSGDGREVSNG